MPPVRPIPGRVLQFPSLSPTGVRPSRSEIVNAARREKQELLAPVLSDAAKSVLASSPKLQAHAESIVQQMVEHPEEAARDTAKNQLALAHTTADATQNMIPKEHRRAAGRGLLAMIGAGWQAAGMEALGTFKMTRNWKAAAGTFVLFLALHGGVDGIEAYQKELTNQKELKKQSGPEKPMEAPAPAGPVVIAPAAAEHGKLVMASARASRESDDPVLGTFVEGAA